MEVSVFRIDDRLIHGQVITAWIAYADAKSIVVADDKAAKDEFTQSLLKMATPDSIQLKILSVEDAITYLKGDEDAGKVLLLVRGPEQALQIIRAGIAKKDINVGNMNMKKERLRCSVICGYFRRMWKIFRSYMKKASNWKSEQYQVTEVRMCWDYYRRVN